MTVTIGLNVGLPGPLLIILLICLRRVPSPLTGADLIPNLHNDNNNQRTVAKRTTY